MNTLNPAQGDASVEVSDEDRTRAGLYAVLGNLFYAPPGKALLEFVASQSALWNDACVTDFSQAWQALQQAARTMDVETVRQEYEAAFLGPGRQAVMLYGSFYTAGFLHDKPLARLREDLAGMGLERRIDRHESEDHVSALCDVMRLLIAGDGASAPAALATQCQFFRRHLAPWYLKLSDALIACEQTVFYKHVGAAMREFFALENAAFDMN